MPSGGTEGEKGKRCDLVFQCCPPPPRSPLLSASFLSGFVSMDTDGLDVYPTLRGGS